MGQSRRAASDQLPVELVPISSLLPGDSPRRHGEDLAHVRTLAETEQKLPPILVHRQSLRVVDGMHRLRAAILRGDRKIAVRFVDGGEEETFLIAVRENVSHGLPLSLADREAAAARIVASHREWSDRAIAAVTGLAAGTVASVRKRLGHQDSPTEMRMGLDGRVRPLDGAHGRELAGEILAARPDTPLREVARRSGISLGTAHAVRKLVVCGKDPAPERRRATRKPDEDVRRDAVPAARTPSRDEQRLDWPTLRQELRRDPTLRYPATGRELLQWLDTHAATVANCRRLAEAVPRHWAAAVAGVVRRWAQECQALADELEQRSERAG